MNGDGMVCQIQMSVIDDKKLTYEMDLLSPEFYLITQLSLPMRIGFVFSLPEISFYVTNLSSLIFKTNYEFLL